MEFDADIRVRRAVSLQAAGRGVYPSRLFTKLADDREKQGRCSESAEHRPYGQRNDDVGPAGKTVLCNN
jgi:hypothetical protein